MLAETFSEPLLILLTPLFFHGCLARVYGGPEASSAYSEPSPFLLSQGFPPVISYISNYVLTSASHRTGTDT